LENPRAAKPSREKAEADALNHLYDGRTRFKSGKTRPIIFRTTEEKRAQILRLADALSSAGNVVSMTQILERGVDALERELKGK
jgi:hypothetical protein